MFFEENHRIVARQFKMANKQLGGYEKLAEIAETTKQSIRRWKDGDRKMKATDAVKTAFLVNQELIKRGETLWRMDFEKLIAWAYPPAHFNSGICEHCGHRETSEHSPT